MADSTEPGSGRRGRRGPGDPGPAPVLDRLRAAFLKPAPSGDGSGTPAEARSLDELRAAERYADDGERFLGLVAAPLGAAIGFFISNYLIDHDPPARLNGAVNPLHASVATYHVLELVLLALSLVILAMAWYRRRLFLGMALALYGLGVFNLHYWGFGVPFVAAGAWLLV
ncbi:MAG TPA: hypothetical protein VKX24_04355, partial [Acidimicrobiia bacterium]|nr:hypothetical protein [Acidimicrobiia bacterium]